MMWLWNHIIWVIIIVFHEGCFVLEAVLLLVISGHIFRSITRYVIILTISIISALIAWLIIDSTHLGGGDVERCIHPLNTRFLAQFSLLNLQPLLRCVWSVYWHRWLTWSRILNWRTSYLTLFIFDREGRFLSLMRHVISLLEVRLMLWFLYQRLFSYRRLS